MARRVVATVHDDIDDRPGAQPHRFGLDDVAYEIDLVPENASLLHLNLATFIEHSRKVSGKSKARVARNGNGNGTVTDAKAIREWWKRTAADPAFAGILPPATDRGRIPEAVQEHYRKSPDPAPAPHLAATPISPPEAPKARGRAPKPMPPVSEVRSVYGQVGTFSGVADHFNVSVSVAKKWVAAASTA
jgi:hypothetical protein